MSPEELIAFEEDIAAEFNAGRIRAPVHLSNGNEEQLIAIFKRVQSQDWVCSTWRSHYHCLLKGVPPTELKAAIISGQSISLCFPKQRVISSAIVGGILPIALGLAWAIKHREEPDRVWAFVGDMTALGGAYHECSRYAFSHSLPITFVVEDNGLSVCTPTPEAWRYRVHRGMFNEFYHYTSKWPHAGAGMRVNF